MTALLYTKRCKHDGRYIYCGGWLVDDGALYQNAAILLIGEGPTEVVAECQRYTIAVSVLGRLAPRAALNLS